MFWPSIRISPPSRSSKPLTTRRSVVLPQPEGPSRVRNSFRATLMDTSSSATTSCPSGVAKRFTACRISSRGRPEPLTGAPPPTADFSWPDASIFIARSLGGGLQASPLARVEADVRPQIMEDLQALHDLFRRVHGFVAGDLLRNELKGRNIRGAVHLLFDVQGRDLGPQVELEELEGIFL